MPSASVAVMAGRPASVAGIFMNKFSRSTSHHSVLASATVLSVSCALRGSTSMDTRPSTASEASYAGRITSQASRTSRPVISRTASSTVTPCSARSLSWASYASASDSAFWKILGLVVTPTTCCSSRSFCSPPVVSRGRERSSSHTATPWAESSASLSVIATPLLSSSVSGRVTGDCADLGQGGVGLGHHVVRGEPELLEQDLGGSARSVVLDADRLAGVADDAVPAHPDAGLDAHPGLDAPRQHR